MDAEATLNQIDAGSARHRLIVCTTCRREGSPVDAPADGGRLY